MTDATVKIDTAPPENLHANMIKLTMGLGGVVFLLMIIFGLVMRTAQGGIIDLDSAIFYQLLFAVIIGPVRLDRCAHVSDWLWST